MTEYIDELRAMWHSALAEAVRNRANKNAAENGGKVKYSINREFASGIDSWDGKTDKTFLVGRTSDALKSIGVKDRNIVWHSGKIAKILKQHAGMTKDIILQVPQILENPVIALKSKQSDTRLAIFGEVRDTNGAIVTAILELQPTNRGGQLLDMNIVASAYGKDTSPAAFIQNSDVVYVDPNIERTKSWMQGLGLRLPSDATTLGFIGRITYNDGKVKIEGLPYQQFMRGEDNNTQIKKSEREIAQERGRRRTEIYAELQKLKAERDDLLRLDADYAAAQEKRRYAATFRERVDATRALNAAKAKIDTAELDERIRALQDERSAIDDAERAEHEAAPIAGRAA